MSCGLGLSFFPNQFKSPTGLMRAGCPIRLKELNSAGKVAPTKLQGSQVARENYIRRRVAKIVQVKDCLPGGNDPKVNKRFKGEECNEYYAYGPIFGLAQAPRYGGDCMKVYYANGGSSSDVTKWKRLYGGSRALFSTSNCKYGCCSKVGVNGLEEECVCYDAAGVSTQLRIGDVLWVAEADNTPPLDLYDAVVTQYNGVLSIRCKGQYSFMSNIIQYQPGTPLYVYRKDQLNNWHLVDNNASISAAGTPHNC